MQEKFQTISAIDAQQIVKFLSKKQTDDIADYIPKNKTSDNKYYLSKIQAEAILKMTLGQLTNLDRQKVITEYKEILEKIKHLCEILDSKELQLDIIYKELQEVKEKFGDKRRTEILHNTEELSNESFIVNEDVIITISHNGFIKRTPASTYRQHNKGGRGSKGTDTYDEDFIEHVFQASTHHHLLFFTDRGKVYKIKVYDLPEQSKNAKGRNINNVLTAKAPDESVTAYLPIKEFKDNEYVMFCTEQGTIKKTELSAFSNVRQTGIIAIGLHENDKLISVRRTDGTNDVILGTRKGLACRFRESNVRAMGRTAAGVRGISLRGDDKVVSMIVIRRQDAQVLVVSERGFGKRTKFEDFRLTNRGGKGVISMNITQKTGDVVQLVTALDTQDLIVITVKGILIRQPIASIRTIGRNTQGVKLIRLDEGDSIADITTIAHQEVDEDKNIDIDTNVPVVETSETDGETLL